jgi:Sec-independent protein secretion pathway component TatC
LYQKERRALRKVSCHRPFCSPPGRRFGYFAILPPTFRVLLRLCRGDRRQTVLYRVGFCRFYPRFTFACGTMFLLPVAMDNGIP